MKIYLKTWLANPGLEAPKKKLTGLACPLGC